MPFESGTFTMTMFEFSSPLPDDAADYFAANKAGTLDNIGEEPQIGWVTGRHLLDTAITGESCQCGGCYYLCLRKGEKRIPASLLNAICRREELAYMESNNLDFVPSKIRKQIKIDVKDRYLPKMTPALSALPMVIEPNEKTLFLGASSLTQQEYFIEHFMNTIKLEPLPINPGYWLSKFFQTTEASFPNMNLAKNPSAPDEPAIGRDFLTYLWYAGEKEIKAKHQIYGEFDAFVEGPLTFVHSSEARGAQETVVKKGENPLRSAEAKAALAAGKKLKKAKLHLCKDNEDWSCTFDADSFSFSSVKLPEVEGMGRDEQMAERVEKMIIFKEALGEFFKLFAGTFMSPEFDKAQQDIRKWAEERDEV